MEPCENRSQEKVQEGGKIKLIYIRNYFTLFRWRDFYYITSMLFVMKL